MIYMAFALYCEAKPFIDELGLKKDSTFEKFPLFRSSGESGEGKGGEILLFISGPGSVLAAAAVAYLCAKLPPGPGDLFVNFGICAGNASVKKGELYRIHSICDHSQKRWFYPDLLLMPGGCEEEALVTVPTAAKTMTGLCCALADMEAAGMYQSAQLFFEQHQMLFFKVVYDQPDEDGFGGGNKNTPAPYGLSDLTAQVEKLCKPWAKMLCRELLPAHRACILDSQRQQAAFSEQELAAEEAFAKLLRATAAMRGQLHQILYYKKLSGAALEHFISDFCEKNNVSPCHSKKEGMKWLCRLRETLWI